MSLFSDIVDALFPRREPRLEFKATRVLVNGIGEYQPQIVDHIPDVGNIFVDIGDPVDSLEEAMKAIDEHKKKNSWKTVA